MGYNIIVSPRAQKEILNAIEYYSMYSELAPQKFIESISFSYNLISQNPFHEIRYKNIRSVKLTFFPYSLFYVLNESTQQVKIISCFHNKLNPKKRP